MRSATSSGGHKYKATAAEASAAAVKAGTDLTCGNEYRSLEQAVKDGEITEVEIDQSLRRLVEARFRLGMFDPADRVPLSKIPYSVVDSAEHRKLALDAARKSIVLLKNENGILPLRHSVRKIAVIGPAADDADSLMGNYNGISSNQVPRWKAYRHTSMGELKFTTPRSNVHFTIHDADSTRRSAPAEWLGAWPLRGIFRCAWN